MFRDERLPRSQKHSERESFAGEKKHEDVVTKIGGWVHPLMVYLRTPEGAALDARVRGEIASALSILGESQSVLGRREESEEALRLAVQYAQEGPVAADVYRTLARVMIAESRAGEAIGPLRRALALEPNRHELLLELAACFLSARRTVAALGCLRDARAKGVAGADIDALAERVRKALGEPAQRFEVLLAGR